MKHYTVTVYKKPPQGGLIRYDRIDAECKKDLKEKVAEFNKKSKDEYIKLSTAFTLGV